MKTSNDILAIRTEDMEAIRAFREYSAKFTAADIKAAAEAVSSRPDPAFTGFDAPSTVAVIPVKGLLTEEYTMETWWFNGTAYSDVSKLFSMAVASPDTQRIIFDIDSPGGYINGLFELMGQIKEGRENKQIVAYVKNIGASAAYGIASQAHHIVASESALVGSVGVLVEYCKYEPEGYSSKTIVSTLSPDKNPDPFTAKGESEILAQVDFVAQMFIDKIAAGREVSPEYVSAMYGKGRVMFPPEAMHSGLIDSVGNFKSALGIIPAKNTGQAGKNSGKAQGGKKMNKIIAKIDQSKKMAKLVVVDDEQVDVSSATTVEEINKDWIKENLPDVYKEIETGAVDGEMETQKEIDKEIEPQGKEELALVASMRWQKGMTVEKIGHALMKHRSNASAKLQTDRAEDAAGIPNIAVGTAPDMDKDKQAGKEIASAGKQYRGLK